MASAQGSRLAGIERASPLGRAPVRLRGVQILVIEDAPDVLDVLTMLLRFEGADVTRAGGGHGRHFDVVVSDLGLPDIAVTC